MMKRLLKNADHIIDIGPKAGIHGGHIVTEGNFAKILKSNNSLTAQYLKKKKEIPVPIKRRTNNKYNIFKLLKVKTNNGK